MNTLVGCQRVGALINAYIDCLLNTSGPAKSYLVISKFWYVRPPPQICVKFPFFWGMGPRLVLTIERLQSSFNNDIMLSWSSAQNFHVGIYNEHRFVFNSLGCGVYWRFVVIGFAPGKRIKLKEDKFWFVRRT